MTQKQTERRKLLLEIQRLAEVAIFGTLSTNYRTCGHPGCHCHGPGPKHGPHLNVSYRGEGQDHRLLRAAGCATRHAPGRGCLAELQERLRRLAELNKESILKQAREDRD